MKKSSERYWGYQSRTEKVKSDSRGSLFTYNIYRTYIIVKRQFVFFFLFLRGAKNTYIYIYMHT